MTTTSVKDWLSVCLEADPEYYDEKRNQPAYEWSNGKVHVAKDPDVVTG